MKRSILTALFLTGLSFSATYVSAQFSVTVGVSIRTPPPAIPVYTQPACPVDGWLWTPGYWAYDDIDGYYWVPGVWIAPPRPGLLWTPGYWGYVGGVYGWHAGYWGPHIGFYGGVNYGFGYGGAGFVGGEWHGGVFRYNTAVVNVNTTVVHNTYVNNTVIVNNTTVNRVSYNGGAGTSARPSPQEQTAMRENHVAPTQEQFSHNQTASRDRNAFASANGGRPATTSMSRVGGDRFGSAGHNAPAPMARPAGRPANQAAMSRNNPGPQGHPQNARPTQHFQQQPRPQPQPHGRPREEGEGHRGEHR